MGSQSQTCGTGQRLCWTAPDWVPGRPEAQPYCCPFPEQQWSCGDKDNGYKCRNQCPPFNAELRVAQKPTWSAEKYQGGRPKRYNCCPVPDTIPKDGECHVNCRKLYGPTWRQCSGGTCCPPDTRCQGKKCVKMCASSRAACGDDECCLPNESCCLRTTCCPPDKRCCGRGPGSGTCCDQAEYCLFKLPPGMKPSNAIGKAQNLTCVSDCPKADRCGSSCCGRGFVCKGGRCLLSLKGSP